MITVVFWGSPQFALPCLQALHHHPHFNLKLVVTQPDAKAGRGQKTTPCAVAQYAQTHALPLLRPRGSLRDATLQQQLRSLGVDFFVVAAYGRIFPTPLLALPNIACINVHASLLPQWRGASPIAQAIWHNQTRTGISIMRMDAGLDTGDVYAQQACDILPQDDAGSLGERLATLGANMLPDCLQQIYAGQLQPIPQVHHLASTAPLLRKEDGLLDFKRSATALCCQIRALSPWPGTYCFLPNHKRLKILQANPCPTPSGIPSEVGRIVAMNAQGIQITTAAGLLNITQLQPENRPKMSAQSFAAGQSIWLGQLLWQSQAPSATLA